MKEEKFSPSEILNFALHLFGQQLDGEYDYESAAQLFISSGDNLNTGIKIDDVKIIECGFDKDCKLPHELRLYHVLIEVLLSGMDTIVRETQNSIS